MSSTGSWEPVRRNLALKLIKWGMDIKIPPTVGGTHLAYRALSDRITSECFKTLVNLSIMRDESKPKKQNAFAQAASVFRERGGVLRTMEAVRLGVHPRTLYAMRDAGVLERLGRGVYRLADLPPLGNPDLVTVALRIPEGVLCLISALAFHEITTQIPHEVYLALKRGAEPPRLKYPPVRVFWFTGRAFTESSATTRAPGPWHSFHLPFREPRPRPRPFQRAQGMYWEVYSS